MSKAIRSIKLSDTLTLSECRDGWWLYDTTRGRNLAMRAKTEVSACVEAITHYQKRLSDVQTEHKALKVKVDAFLSQFPNDEDSWNV